MRASAATKGRSLFCLVAALLLLVAAAPAEAAHTQPQSLRPDLHSPPLSVDQALEPRPAQRQLALGLTSDPDLGLSQTRYRVSRHFEGLRTGVFDALVAESQPVTADLTTNSPQGHLLFQGRDWHADLGLYHYRARWYDPTLGNFIEPDPLGPVDSANLYQGFGWNPHGLSDPSGLDTAVTDEAMRRIHRSPGEKSPEERFLSGVGDFFSSAWAMLGQCVNGFAYGTGEYSGFRGCVEGFTEPVYETRIEQALATGGDEQEGVAIATLQMSGWLVVSDFYFGEDPYTGPIDRVRLTGQVATAFTTGIIMSRALTADLAPRKFSLELEREIPSQGVRPYEVDTALALRRRSLPRDGLAIDHQPSHASNVARLEAEVGRPLTPSEIREINNQGAAVAVPDDWHRSGSRTYGGRNTRAQIAADAADPVAAAIADSERMIEGVSPDLEAAARHAAEELRRLAGGG